MGKHLLRVASVIAVTAVALTAASPVRAEEKPAKEKATRHQITGVIESIDSKASLIKIKKGTEVKEVTCAATCKFSTATKESATMDDLKVGDKVTAICSEEGGKMICHKVMPPKAAEKKPEKKSDK